MQVTRNGGLVDDGQMLYVDNRGQRHGLGEVGRDLIDSNFNYGLRRPIRHTDGKPYVIVNTGETSVEKGVRRPVKRMVLVRDVLNGDAPGMDGIPVINPILLAANASALPKESWIELDRVTFDAYRSRLNAWNILSSKSPLGGFDAYAAMTYEYEAMSDPGFAAVDMFTDTDDYGDSPLFKLRSTPLPIVHSGTRIYDRMLAASRRAGKPLDTIAYSTGARRIAEVVEKTLLGVDGGFSGFNYGAVASGPTAHDTATTGVDTGAALGGSTIYGYRTWPHRFTDTTFTAPVETDGTPNAAWTPVVTKNEVLRFINHMRTNKVYGPFTLYLSVDWTRFFDQDYAVTGGNNPNETLRTMLMKIPQITDIVDLDFFDDFDGDESDFFELIFVDHGSGTVQALNGMGLRNVQWESKGGALINVRTMVIQVPIFRSDFTGLSGIGHVVATPPAP